MKQIINKNIKEKMYVKKLNEKLQKYDRKVKVRCIMKAGKNTIGHDCFGITIPLNIVKDFNLINKKFIIKPINDSILILQKVE